MPIIEAHNISKEYRIPASNSHFKYRSIRDDLFSMFHFAKEQKNRFQALDNLSFDIHRGESIGIIGKNGAGKSTLLKILSKITPPTKGYIDMRGRVASLLEVGTGFHPELTGRENIFLNGALMGMKRNEIQSKFDEIVDFSGVETFIDTPVKHYSNGMFVRLGFAVAAHLEPEILIVDEVLAVGDNEFRKKSIGKMREVSQNSGRTVLFVSHSMTAIQELCQKTILLEKGKMIAFDQTNKVIEQYTKSYHQNTLIIDESKDTYFSKMSMESMDDGIAAPFPKSNCPLKIHLEISTKKTIKNAEIAIGFYDLIGNKIINPYSRFVDKKFDLQVGKNNIECQIDRLPLKPELYNMVLFIGHELGTIEYYDKGLSIEVFASSHLGAYQIPTQTQGYILIEEQWSKK